MPLHQAMAFVERAAVGERIENLGFLVGGRTEIAQLGSLGRIIKQSMTLCNALMAVAEIINCYNSRDRIWLLPDHDPVLLCHAFIFLDASGIRQGNLYTIMLLIKIVRLAVGATWWPRGIRLPRAETTRRKDYEALFHTDVAFHGLGAYALVLDRPLLARAIAVSGSGRESLQDDAAFLRSSAPARDLAARFSKRSAGCCVADIPTSDWSQTSRA